MVTGKCVELKAHRAVNMFCIFVTGLRIEIFLVKENFDLLLILVAVVSLVITDWTVRM